MDVVSSVRSGSQRICREKFLAALVSLKNFAPEYELGVFPLAGNDCG